MSSADSAVTPLPEPGEALGGYVLERVLGRGGMGAVYVGRDRNGAQRAIKVPLFLGDDANEARARFELEARSLAKLPPHPGVVRIHGAGVDRGFSFCILELIEGEGLDRILAHGPVPVERALAIVEEVARALAHVHAQGIVHRDVKPANVLIRAADGRAVLTDFGLARDIEERERLTKTGTTLGTPAYMAPEQHEGRKDIDARADVYACGVLLHALIAGEPPFQGGAIQIMKQALTDDPTPLRRLRPEVSRDMETIALRAMAKERLQRYRTAQDLADDLSRARRGEAILARPIGSGERLFRWIRHHRVVATAIVLGTLLAGGTGVAVLRNVRELDRQTDAAKWKRALEPKSARLTSQRKAARRARVGIPPGDADERELRAAAAAVAAHLEQAPESVEAEVAAMRALVDQTPLALAELALFRGNLAAVRSGAREAVATHPADVKLLEALALTEERRLDAARSIVEALLRKPAELEPELAVETELLQTKVVLLASGRADLPRIGQLRARAAALPDSSALVDGVDSFLGRDLVRRLAQDVEKGARGDALLDKLDELRRSPELAPVVVRGVLDDVHSGDPSQHEARVLRAVPVLRAIREVAPEGLRRAEADRAGQRLSRRLLGLVMGEVGPPPIPALIGRERATGGTERLAAAIDLMSVAVWLDVDLDIPDLYCRTLVAEVVYARDNHNYEYWLRLQVAAARVGLKPDTNGEEFKPLRDESEKQRAQRPFGVGGVLGRLRDEMKRQKKGDWALSLTYCLWLRALDEGREVRDVANELSQYLDPLTTDPTIPKRARLVVRVHALDAEYKRAKPYTGQRDWQPDVAVFERLARDFLATRDQGYGIPDDALAWAAECYAYLGRFDEAIKCAKEAVVAADDRVTRAASGRPDALAEGRPPGLPLEAPRQGARRGPGAIARKELIDFLLATHRDSEAFEVAESLATSPIEGPAARKLKARVLAGVGRFEEAEALVRVDMGIDFQTSRSDWRTDLQSLANWLEVVGAAAAPPDLTLVERAKGIRLIVGRLEK